MRKRYRVTLMSNEKLTVASALTKTVVRIAGIIQDMVNFVFKFMGIRRLTIQRYRMQKFHGTLFSLILRFLFQNQY